MASQALLVETAAEEIFELGPLHPSTRGLPLLPAACTFTGAVLRASAQAGPV